MCDHVMACSSAEIHRCIAQKDGLHLQSPRASRKGTKQEPAGKQSKWQNLMNSRKNKLKIIVFFSLFAIASFRLFPWLTFQPWRLRHYVPPKRQWATELHSVTSQKIALFVVTGRTTSNPVMYSKRSTCFLRQPNHSTYRVCCMRSNWIHGRRTRTIAVECLAWGYLSEGEAAVLRPPAWRGQKSKRKEGLPKHYLCLLVAWCRLAPKHTWLHCVSFWATFVFTTAKTFNFAIFLISIPLIPHSHGVESYFIIWIYTQSVGLPERVIGPSRGRRAQTQRKHTQTPNIYVRSGIRTHDHSVRASEDG
jgi:hypothetical protein